MEISDNDKVISFADNERLWRDYRALPFATFAAIYLEPAMRQLDQYRTPQSSEVATASRTPRKEKPQPIAGAVREVG